MKEDKKINLVVRSNIRKALKDKIPNVAEEVEEALAIIRLNNFDGESNFKTDDEGRLYTEIRYTKGNEINFLRKEKTDNNTNDFGFHYNLAK